MVYRLKVELFKHLGLVISSDLSWSNYITSISAKAKKILGLLYRQYYNHVEGHVLKQLDISLVRPHLEYSCAYWRTRGTLSRSKNLHVRWHQSTAWDAGYEDLLELVGLPPLEQRRIYLEIMSTIQNYSWPVSIPHWDFYSRANSSQL